MKYEVGQVTVLDRGDNWLIVVEVSATNGGDDPATVPYFGWPDISRLRVDGLALGDGQPVCFSLIRGDPSLEPGDRAVGLAGFVTDEDPTGGKLVLELFGGSTDIQLTAG